MTDTFTLCGITFQVMTTRLAVQAVVTAGALGQYLPVHLCNAYTLSLVDKDPLLKLALRQPDVMNFPDGWPVAFAGRRAGQISSVRGPDLMRGVLDEGRTAGLSHFFYGGTSGSGEELVIAMTRQFPGLRIVGLEEPPWTRLSEEALIALGQRVRASGASVVWIGLGTPRQDYLTERLRGATDAVVVPVGAAFDFLSNRVEEVPVFFRESGGEWLYRLCKEPKRLWRRYTVGNIRFLLSVARHRRAER